MKKVFLSLLLILGVTGCVFEKEEPAPELKEEKEIVLVDNLSFEIFSEITVKDLIGEGNQVEIVNEDEKVDTSKLGENIITIQYKDKKKEKEHDVRIKIVDTEAPVITFEKEITTTVGKSVSLTNGVKVSDNSKEDISVSVSGDYDFNKAGEYELKYVAFDSSNNKTEESFKLIVKEEEKKNTSSSSSNTKTNSDTNSNTKSNTKNNNSSSSSTTSKAKYTIGKIDGVGKSYFRGYYTYTSDMSKWRAYDECTLTSFTVTPVVYKNIDSKDALRLDYKVKWTKKDSDGESSGCWAKIKITDEGGNVLLADVETFGKGNIITKVGNSSTYTGSIHINTKMDLIEGTKINITFSDVSKRNLK